MRAGLVTLALALAVLLAACVAASPTPGPEARCAVACHARARACSEEACARGCRLVLDKLVEREGARVLGCVAGAPARRACDEATFATCAAWSGPYADGGPRPPRPPSDEDEP